MTTKERIDAVLKRLEKVAAMRRAEQSDCLHKQRTAVDVLAETVTDLALILEDVNEAALDAGQRVVAMQNGIAPI